MRYCPQCRQTYDDNSLNYCLDDGSRLIPIAKTDEPVTAIMGQSGEVDSYRTISQEQDIRYCSTSDGVRIAYSVVGSGPLLVRVLGHFTHLEMEWSWPDLRHFWERLADDFTVVRYDGRGIGLSDKYD